MYNETVRKYDAYYGSLLYERKEGIKEGLQREIEQGRSEGEISAFTKMVRDGYLTKEIAAGTLGISIEEFEKYL